MTIGHHQGILVQDIHLRHLRDIIVPGTVDLDHAPILLHLEDATAPGLFHLVMRGDIEEGHILLLLRITEFNTGCCCLLFSTFFSFCSSYI